VVIRRPFDYFVVPVQGEEWVPVRARNVRHLDADLTFLLKPRVRRLYIPMTTVGSHGDRRQDVKIRPLWPEHERELLVFLDRIGPLGRLFLHNVRRDGAELTARAAKRSLAERTEAVAA
jgi:hypothetical protein